jgi:hypothetical protein
MNQTVSSEFCRTDADGDYRILYYDRVNMKVAIGMGGNNMPIAELNLKGWSGQNMKDIVEELYNIRKDPGAEMEPVNN